jgi:membrane-associated protease RseP (regulator of RpoE activity)
VPSPAPLPPADARPNWALALGLFVATFFTMTTMGVDWVLSARTDVISPLPQYALPVPFVGDVPMGNLLSPATVRMVWTTPALLRVGLAFSLPVMLILLCHELGHYLFCRRYRIPATLPYFIPGPFAFGTFGAFIRIRGAIPDRRRLFDVGIAGPIAGFVALVPFLIYGVAHSEPVRVTLAPLEATHVTLQVPGMSILSFAVTALLHGTGHPGTVLNPHPFLLAAWVGLLATSLNLIPLSQLDGGHILYAAVGRLQWKLAWPLWFLFVAVVWIFPGWALWAIIVWRIGLFHPPVADEATPLGPGRRALAVVALVMLIITFMPVPIVQVGIKSSTNVTGPSLTSSTAMRARNLPVATVSP